MPLCPGVTESNLFQARRGIAQGFGKRFLTVDELEAIRLADKEGLYQTLAAVQMNVSRSTFGRILEAAHKKVAEAIVCGKQLCIQGGLLHSDEGLH